MIKSVTVTNYLGDSIELELAHPEKSGLLVYNIEGLGPVNANINMTELATADGGIYTSSRATTRNIVLTLAMQNPGQMTIEDSRYLTYKFFPVKHEVTLVFETDTRTAQTTGYVESNEPVIFSQEEYTTISIICPDSYFYSVWNSEMVFSGVQPLFEFPFANESVPAVETAHPNLLSNWYFVDPMNSQGKTEYDKPNTDIEAIDDWFLSSGTITCKLASDGLICTNPSPDSSNRHAQIRQYCRFNDLRHGETYTASVLISEVSGEAVLTFCQATTPWTAIAQAVHITSPGLYSVTGVLNDPATEFGDHLIAIYVRESSTAKLVAAKLELGSTQTLAHQDSNGNWVINDLPPKEPFNPKLEMGKILLDTRAILPYKGDAEAGVRIVAHAMDTVDDITIYNIETRETMFIDTAKLGRMTGRVFGTGDDIEISTYSGRKYARLLREGKYTNIISCISRDSDWFHLSNGDNLFQFAARTGEENLTMTFYYRDTYGGI